MDSAQASFIEQENQYLIEDISLGTKAADVIRDFIIKGECPPGSRLLEADLAKMLGVSRASIREAMMILDHDGLLVRNPNKSAIVKLFTEKDIDDIYRLRSAIETSCLASCMAFKRIDMKRLDALSVQINQFYEQREQDNGIDWIKADLAFHEYLVLESGNAYAYKVWRSLKNQILTVLYYAVHRLPDILVPAGNDGAHENITRYIEQNDPERAIFQLQTHIMNGAVHVTSSFK